MEMVPEKDSGDAETSDAEAYLSKGLNFHKNGALRDARRMYERVIEINPSHARAHTLLGNVLYYTGGVDDAIECYHRAVDIDPEYAVAYTNWGIILEEKGDLEGAKLKYGGAIEADANYAEAYSNLGSVLQQMGDLFGAYRNYKKAIEIDEGLTKTREDLERVLDKVKEQVKIRNAVKEAEDFLKKGAAFEEAGDLNNAIENYQRAIYACPGLLIAHYILGIAFEKTGDRKRAMKSYGRAVEIDPKVAAHDTSPEALEILGKQLKDAYIGVQDFVNLAEKFQTAFKEKETLLLDFYKPGTIERPEDFLKIGAALEAAGNLDEAIKNYEKAIKTAPYLPIPYYVLGLALERRGDLEGATANYKKAAEMDIGFLTPATSPELSAILAKQLGNVYMRSLDSVRILNDFKKSIGEGQASLQEFIKYKLTGEAEERIKRGFLLDESGSWTSAIDSYSRAVDIDPNNVIAYYIMGLAYENIGELEMAMGQYEKIGNIDLTTAPRNISREVIEILDEYLGRTTKDGHRVGTILIRYIRLIGENPDKMLQLLGYIEDVKLGSLSAVVQDSLKGKTGEEGRIIRDEEDFPEERIEERFVEKAEALGRVGLLWKYKTARTIRCVANSSEGEHIVAGSENGNIYFLGRHGELKWKAKAGENILDVDISSDGNYAVACLYDGTVQLLDASNSGKVLWKIPLSEHGARSVAISADGSSVAVGAYYSNILLIQDGKVVWEHPLRGCISRVAISADGKTIAGASDNGVIYILKNHDGVPTEDTYHVKNALCGIAISPDGKYIAAGSESGEVYFFNVNKATLWKRDLKSSVYALAISSQGQYSVAGASNGTVHFFNRKGQLLWKYQAEANTWSVDVSLSGAHVVVGCGLVFGSVYLLHTLP